jgi:hypothetical protein
MNPPMLPLLPPGPAFIPAQDDEMDDCEDCRDCRRVPPGYLWSPGTESTMAGWVRPLGKSE